MDPISLSDTPRVPQVPVAVLEFSLGTWSLRIVDLIDNDGLPDICYIFLENGELFKNGGAEFRKKVLELFNVPDFLYDQLCTELNGFFSFKSELNASNQLVDLKTWFRCLIKQVLKPMEFSADGHPYRWYEMGFFTHWNYLTPRICGCKILCIDTPESLRGKLLQILQQSPDMDFRDPFIMTSTLFDEIVKLYDDCIWRLRDQLRYIEIDGGQADFRRMHMVSRHANHISETLGVTVDTIEKLQQQQTSLSKRLPSCISGNEEEVAQHKIKFQLQLLQNIKVRSDYLRSRLVDEITLAVNMNNLATTHDTSNMKVIAILTSIFLPFTFVAVLLTTPMFKWPDPPEGHIIVTLPFALYWGISAALAIVLGAIMLYLAYNKADRQKHHSIRPKLMV